MLGWPDQGITIVLHLVLDNEAVQALADAAHPKHGAVLAHFAAVVTRRRRGRDARAVVPTTVRVEAGWDRTRRAAAVVNRLRIVDLPLDADAANRAATIKARAAVSVTDAHIGAVIGALAELRGDRVVVLTSDPDDIRRTAPSVAVTVVPI